MRVVHIITRLVVGGAQENTVTSVLGLLGKPGVEVRLLSGPTRGPEGSLEPVVRKHPELLHTIPELIRPVHPWFDLLAWRRLRQSLKTLKPDIVHTHSGKAGVLGRLAAAQVGVPAIVHTIHGPSFGPFQGFLANLLFRSAERIAGTVTTQFVSVADAMSEQYLAAGIGTPEQYQRIFSGFDLNPFLTGQPQPELARELDLKPDDIVVGKIARLFKLKGHDDLIDVAPRIVAQCPQVKFLIVGDGEWRSRLEQRVATEGLQDHFRFTGLVPPAQVPRYVALMDVLVHLSRREGLPRALPQALAAGCPVVAYDCDGAREVCRTGETGFLIPPGDTQRLETALMNLLRTPNDRRRLGENGRLFVRANFSAETMVTSLFNLYQRLMDRSARSSAPA